MKSRLIVLLSLFLVPLVLLAPSCATTIPKRRPVGEAFPAVVGETLAGERITLPGEDVEGSRVLVVGYGEGARFDMDRWWFGLRQAEVGVPVVEVLAARELGTIESSRWVEPGLRTEFPGEDGAVVRLRGEEAKAVAALTGNEDRRRARVVVLDAEGRVAWLEDEGYSAGRCLRVVGALGGDRDRDREGDRDRDRDRDREGVRDREGGKLGSIVGREFPSVQGTSLAKEEVEIPADLVGEPVVLLIGYLQTAQLDIDRWILGLVRGDVKARLLELPTMPSTFASLASGWIDDGMRSGIPDEDWSAVVTLYGAAARPVAELTGTADGHLARVCVLDASGRVVWFDDGGFEEHKVAEVAKVVAPR